MADVNQFPYFHLNNNKSTNKLAEILLRRIKSKLRLKNKYHCLVCPHYDKKLKFIQKNSKEYKYFLRLDIEKFYPSVNHSLLLSTVKRILLSRTERLRQTNWRAKKRLEIIQSFLLKTPVRGKGLPIGNYLGWVLAGIYILPF